jgi:hypothetical protein
MRNPSSREKIPTFGDFNDQFTSYRTLAYLIESIVHQGQGSRQSMPQQAASLCQRHAAARSALEKAHFQPIFERFDLVADSGGGNPQLLSRPAEATVPGGRLENNQRPKRHGRRWPHGASCELNS